MILPDVEIRRLCIEHGMVHPYDIDSGLQNPASLDVTLGGRLMIETPDSPELEICDIGDRTRDRPYLLQPGEFVLAETMEVFNLPSHVAAQFVLKSSRAREGLEHLLAGFCDPGWNGSVLTLELHNARRYHPVALWPGMKIGQMVFHSLASVPERDYSITGRYNGHLTVHGSLG